MPPLWVGEHSFGEQFLLCLRPCRSPTPFRNLWNRYHFWHIGVLARGPYTFLAQRGSFAAFWHYQTEERLYSEREELGPSQLLVRGVRINPSLCWIRAISLENKGNSVLNFGSLKNSLNRYGPSSSPSRPILGSSACTSFWQLAAHEQPISWEKPTINRQSLIRSGPGKPNQRKVSSWTFHNGIPEQKFTVNRACFPKEKHQNSQKWAKFMSFSFWPFLWFGLPGRVLD